MQKIVDFEKVMKKAEVLDDGEEISITFQSGADKEMIETLKIPKDMKNIETESVFGTITNGIEKS